MIVLHVACEMGPALTQRREASLVDCLMIDEIKIKLKLSIVFQHK